MTEKQKLIMKRTCEFFKKYPNILMLGNAMTINQIKLLEESRLNTEIAWRNYKKKVEEFERKGSNTASLYIFTLRYGETVTQRTLTP